MADTKISALTALATPALEDLVALVDDPAGTPITKKATLGALLLLAWPIGSIYESVVSTDPGTLFGGTWAALGAGRVLVGIDGGDADFDTAEETGGAKTHTHTYTEVVNHVHVQNLPGSQTGNFASGTRDTSSGGTGGTSTSTPDVLSTANPTGGVATGTTVAGSGVQPYLVIYRWKRTA